MAEMLVDGAKLDACLDAEADAIRTKTGDSNDLTFDFANNKGFADAIAAIEAGGGNPVEKTVYTHVQDWSTSAAGGNTRNFLNAYFNKGNGLYYATIENNTASGDYKAIAATASIGMTKSNTVAFQRTANDANDVGTTWSYLVSAGATVIVWFIPKGAFV